MSNFLKPLYKKKVNVQIKNISFKICLILLSLFLYEDFKIEYHPLYFNNLLSFLKYQENTIKPSFQMLKNLD